MTFPMIRFARLLLAACAFMAAISASYAQESLVKAEALVRMQSIPLSRPMTFEQAYSAELLDYAAWLCMRALDTSSAWGPANRGWNLYRLNLRMDLEEKQNQRWQTSSGTIRSLSQNPDTSLAKYWSDALSPAELDELSSFYQSAAGKKFLSYQSDLQRAYYRGKLVFEQLKFDPTLPNHNPSIPELRALWLKRNSLPPESTTQAYAFHAQALQRIFPTIPLSDLVFDLAGGATPGTPAMDRLNNALTESEREAVRDFLKSPLAAKELQATKAWKDSVQKTQDLVPLVISDIRGLVELITSWQKTRADPDSLPRSIAAIEPDTFKIPETLNPERLEDSGMVRLKQCLPTTSERDLQDMEKFIQNKEFLKASKTIRYVATPALYVTRGQYGACIPTTAAGYPVMAVDSFAESISVVGMPEAESQAWYRRIAQELAANGSSDSLITSAGGNAFEVSYAIDVRRPTQLIYKIKFMPAGTFNASSYRITVNPSIFKSIITTSTGGTGGISRKAKSILSTPEDLKKAAESAKRNAG